MTYNVYCQYTDWQTFSDLTCGTGDTPTSTTVTAWCAQASRDIDAMVGKIDVTNNYDATPDEIIQKATIRMVHVYYLRWRIERRGEWALGHQVNLYIDQICAILTSQFGFTTRATRTVLSENDVRY